MGWKHPPSPPPGYELAVVGQKDTLQLFAELLAARDGLTIDQAARALAKANGVDDPGRRTCVWSRDIDTWVLARGGVRNAGDANVCDARGFTGFQPGNEIYLPFGFRPRALLQPLPSGPAVTVARSALPTAVKLGGALAAGLLVRRFFRRRRGAA